jgi:hypothetical protein
MPVLASRLLTLDQAFFPGGYRTSQQRTPAGNQAALRSEDIVKVNRVFRALSEAVQRTKRRLQIIVLEHADEETWHGLQHVTLTERWRNNTYLVPPDWLRT